MHSLRLIVTAASFPLTSEITQFIPECARECFLSFLDVNYEENPCSGGFTSLQCLCASRGASGFTIGEGLAQCIGAEKAIGFCSDTDASDEVIVSAFEMCRGKPGAIPATHTVFTATLILPPSGPGVISFPPVTTTKTDLGSSTSSSDIATETTLVTETSASPTPSSRIPTDTESVSETSVDETTASSSTSTTDATTGFVTTTRGSSTETATSTASSTAEPVPDIPAGDADADGEADGADEAEQDNADDGKLTTAQIAGISVGVASAAGFAIIAIFLARYYRRQRRLPEMRSIFSNSKRDTWPYKDSQNDESGSMAGVARQINEPIDALGSSSRVAQPPPTYAHPSWPMPVGEMALPAAAVTRGEQDSQRQMVDRRTSRLLPAKPVFIPPVRRVSPIDDPFRDQAVAAPAPWERQQNLSRTAGAPQATPQQASEATMAQARQQLSPPRPIVAVSKPSDRQGQQPANTIAPNLRKAQPPIPLSLTIPESSTQAGATVPAPRTQTNAAPAASRLERDSGVTEFEEDGGASALTARSGGQVWVPPSAHPSGLTYYFSDPSGNWVLRNSQPPLPNADNGGGNGRDGALAPAAEISRVEQRQQQQLQQQQQQQQQAPRSSSVYSQHMPRPLFSGPRHVAPNRRSHQRHIRPESDDSGVTQFSAVTSNDVFQDPPPPPPPQSNLSPVVESPPRAAPFGGPRGAPRNSSNLRLAPPRTIRPYHPPGQPSPTLGLMQPPPPSQQQDPFRPYNPSSRTNEAPPPPRYNGQQYNGPSTLRIVRPSPSPPGDRDLLPSTRREYAPPTSPTPGPWRPPQPASTQIQHRAPSTSFHLPLRPQDTREPQLPYQSPPRQPPSSSSRTQPPESQSQPQAQAQQPPLFKSTIRHPSTQTTSSTITLPTTPSSTTSSLLTKRLGQSRAANMSFPAVRPPSTQQRWAQKNAGTTTTNHTNDNAGNGSNNSGGMLSPGAALTTTQFEQGVEQQAPMTPTWVPRLTPTRRGDDLFLNVQ